MEQQRAFILSRVLSQDARARLGTIKLVKPERAHAVENLVIHAAQSGQISPSQPLDDAGLVSLLKQIDAKTQPSSKKKIIIKRKVALDDDW
mmetsp:Transcript_926/g.1285  ORF Transcript_926/g.1285 Transcript_926/m.1285 type:complete len:91 (+) Transcript_926:864-1136(+)